MYKPTVTFDAFTESAKALAEIVMGSDLTDQFHSELITHSQLLKENEELRAKVISLQENSLFEERYLNLQREFRKIAAERDSLSSQALKANHILAEYERLKQSYQESRRQLITLQNELDKVTNPINTQTTTRNNTTSRVRAF